MMLMGSAALLSLTQVEGGYSKLANGNLTKYMTDLKAGGINIIAPSFPYLLDYVNGQLMPSDYAKAARAAGLNIITWTMERSDCCVAVCRWRADEVT